MSAHAYAIAAPLCLVWAVFCGLDCTWKLFIQAVAIGRRILWRKSNA